MKHLSRKILHGVLDLLPIIIIGVFAIYSHRHEPTQSITYVQNELLDFNQLVAPRNNTNVAPNGSTAVNVDYEITINASTTTSGWANIGGSVANVMGHVYLVQLNRTLVGSNVVLYPNQLNLPSQVDSFISTSVSSAERQFITIATTGPVVDFSFCVFVFDLTQIYGAGNEPTLVSEFTDDFPLQLYPYTLSEKILNKNVSEITYSDTDIGSQMVYALYNPIDKYFNLNKVANFEQVYDFFQVQFFNGNAPISIFIVWNIILYQFIMDIIFLVYMVFMFIIDFIGGMLDFMFRKSFGGAK